MWNDINSHTENTNFSIGPAYLENRAYIRMCDVAITVIVIFMWDAVVNLCME